MTKEAQEIAVAGLRPLSIDDLTPLKRFGARERRPALANEKFWMVKGDGPTTVMHYCREDAMNEAERLARTTPGKKFYVMEAIGQFERVDVKFTELATDGTPF